MFEHVARLALPTPYGLFDLRAVRCPSGFVYLALVAGDLGDGHSVLTRVHSECLTGDALGSLRCDCGVQLQAALKAVSAARRGVVLYATGHEGRGIGLVNKLLAYVHQDAGADTVDANLHLGLPVDKRDYSEAAGVLASIGVRSIRLLSNNPAKARGLEEAGMRVDEIKTLSVAPHSRNARYLGTKLHRLGHNAATAGMDGKVHSAPDVDDLLGPVRPSSTRPYVVLKYAQSLDGRIATRTGDAKWISSEQERTVAHALRARCDGIMVGSGTVVNDDPQLTVRMVHGVSPVRVIVDSRLRSSLDAHVFDDAAATVAVTTEASDPGKRRLLRDRDIGVWVLPANGHGVDLVAGLAMLRRYGVESLLVEGGAGLITSLLGLHVVDRIIVSVAPRLLGAGIEAIGDLGTQRVGDGLSLENPIVRMAGGDVLIAGDVSRGTTGNGYVIDANSATSSSSSP